MFLLFQFGILSLYKWLTILQILKAVCVTYSTVSFEEESREVYRLQQRSLKKRVSFAGRDEIKYKTIISLCMFNVLKKFLSFREFKKTEPLLHQPSVEIIANNLLCDNENSYGDMLLKSESPEFCSDNLQDIPYVIPSKTISFSEVKEVREEVFTASIPCVTGSITI